MVDGLKRIKNDLHSQPKSIAAYLESLESLARTLMAVVMKLGLAESSLFFGMLFLTLLRQRPQLAGSGPSSCITGTCTSSCARRPPEQEATP